MFQIMFSVCIFKGTLNSRIKPYIVNILKICVMLFSFCWNFSALYVSSTDNF